MQLKNKRVLVIGGTSGFGLAVAQKVIEAGASAVITDRKNDKLSAVVSRLTDEGHDVAGYILDAGDKAGVRAFFAEVGGLELV